MAEEHAKFDQSKTETWRGHSYFKFNMFALFKNTCRNS